MNTNVSFHVSHAKQCNRINDGKCTKMEVKRKMEVLCNEWSEKSSEDLIRDSFVKIRALAPVEYMLPRNTALLFCRSTGRENKIEINNYYYGSPPCYDAHFYTFNLWISKTSLDLI